MSTWTLTPMIAAVLEVDHPDLAGPTQVVYHSPEYPVIPTDDTRRIDWGGIYTLMPIAVRNAVQKHFVSLFSLPLAERQGYLDNIKDGKISVTL